jgi:hypothetical protein
MATSGTTSFNLQIDEIIEEAISQIGGEVTLGDDVREARRSLDLLLREWQNRGYSLWKTGTEETTLSTGQTTFQPGSNVIDLIIGTIRSGSTDIEMRRITMEEYEKIPNKSQTGRPLQYAVQSTTIAGPTVYFWPLPDVATYTFRYRYFGYTEDSSASRYNADVPTHMLPALTAGLAFKMALKRPGVPDSRVALLKQIYDQVFNEAFESDRDRESLYIRPFFRV